jgi:hypothetical protein
MHGRVRDFYDELAQLARDGADSTQIATGAVLKWRLVDDALSPIVGHGGVVALFRRAVFLTRQSHAALALLPEAPDQPHDFAALQTLLSQQPSVEAAAIATALQHTFVDLLTHLIGESLTERLLRSVWDKTSSANDAQEKSR